MRGMQSLSAPEGKAAWFDRLRKEYPRRREFFNTSVVFTHPDPAVKAQFEGIGFKCP
jgi:hypothetical protein